MKTAVDKKSVKQRKRTAALAPQPKPEAVAVVPRIVKRGACATLNAKGELEYEVGVDGRGEVLLRVARFSDVPLFPMPVRLIRVHDGGNTAGQAFTDHGRGKGRPDAWKHHGKPVFVGSDETWAAVIGPDIAPGAQPTGCASTSQLAATALKALGLDWRAYDPAAGAPLDVFKAAAP